MDIFQQFKTNEALEKSGTWVDFGDGIKFKLASMSARNKDYVKAVEAALKPFKRQIRMKAFSNEKDAEVTREVFADKILIDWTGVKRGDVTIKYSRDAALDLMIELPKLYHELVEQATNDATFLESELEDESKN